MYEIRLLRDTIVYTEKYHKYHADLNSAFCGFSQKGTQIILLYNRPLTESEQAEIQLADVSFVDNDPLDYIVRRVIIPARAFGNEFVDRFAAANVLLGITQAGMTNHVRKAMREVLDALATGSLYDAIYEIRQIPEESKDPVFINDTRLLEAINAIETYLEIPLSTEV